MDKAVSGMLKAEAARETAFENMVDAMQRLAQRVAELEARLVALEDARPSMGP